MDGTHLDRDTSNKGRTIGHGVIGAYAVAGIAVTVMAVHGLLDAWPATLVIAVLFVLVFAGDQWVQFLDMNGGKWKRREDRDGPFPDSTEEAETDGGQDDPGYDVHDPPGG